MNILIIGYGKMGKIIDELAQQRGHNILARLTSKDKWNKDTLLQLKPDVAIEFTHPESAVNNILQCFEANIPVVVGTTGWYQHLNTIISLCKQKNQSLLYAPNFSIGVNLFFKINDYVASLLKKYPEYNVSIIEAHHTQKKDAPSGTAISIAEQILNYYPSKKNWSIDKKNESLHISVRRSGDEKGYHSVIYQSAIDEIQLSHHAFSRKGFALGAILAAEFLKDKKGVFQMKDVLNNI